MIGIGGSGMSGIAEVLLNLDYTVTGSDMSESATVRRLRALGAQIAMGHNADNLHTPQVVVRSSAVKDDNPEIQAARAKNIPVIGRAEMLAELMRLRAGIAIAGTHGKTTTASMLAWVLEECGYKPGFLVGGVLGNFGESARLGESMFFVVEADEYDSAFFDKRSKFVHYRPRTLVLNNLEFDHADIFDDLAAIQRQFHHLIRTVPSTGRIFAPTQDKPLEQVLAQGCWSELEFTGEGGQWKANKLKKDGSSFELYFEDEKVGQVDWDLVGDHNVSNALMVVASARHVGVTPDLACEALGKFINTKRRLELKGEVNGVSVYDDFAHHPTAIDLTLGGLRNKVGDKKIIAVLEPRSSTMKLGVHKDTLAASLHAADSVYLFQPDNITWSVDDVAQQCTQPAYTHNDIDCFVDMIVAEAQPGDQILVMSNGGFEGIHGKLLDKLSQ
jgi:UDP-N-acetylmuramate: L-alanyl-gamma-D-glutamyl-meso-diaminopimelate ligase